MNTQNLSWRAVQRTNFTRLDRLADFLELSPDRRNMLLERPKFPLNLPRRLAEKIAKGTLEDPILRQFVPLAEETASGGCSFVQDPVGDIEARQSPRLLTKYHGRALLLATSACAMHCRYCFRQNYPYETTPTLYGRELNLIRKDPSLSEIILSGGDPLSLSDRVLGPLLNALSDIPHVRRIRFHTRFPIGIPERINEPFLDMLSALRPQCLVVVHTNHPSELDADVLAAIKQLRLRGIPVLNQSVLLRGVNDSAETLTALCQTLIDNGILPYYLHLLDQVAGSAHFEVSEQEGKTLIRTLHERLSGYGVPKLVREIAGQPGKTLV